MESIGNDIIALKTTNPSRTIAPRFYNKILAAPELQLYRDTLAHIPFHYFVWLAWSVKEAAYKCLQRLQPDLVFSPVRIEIQSIISPPLQVKPPYVSLESIGFNDSECFICEVSFDNRTLYARSVMYGDELIHTIASFDSDFSAIKWGVKQIESAEPGAQSLAVRTFLLDQLKKLFPLSDILIDKDAAGIPFITIGNETKTVSLSHHDKWVGYVF